MQETFFPGDYGRWQVAWGSLEKVCRSRGSFYLYGPDGAVLALPERAFGSPERADWFAGFLEDRRRVVPAVVQHSVPPAPTPLARFTVVRTKRDYLDWILYYDGWRQPYKKWHSYFPGMLLLLSPIFFIWLVCAWSPLSGPRFLPEAIGAVWAALSGLLTWLVDRRNVRYRANTQKMLGHIDRLEQEDELRQWLGPRAYALYADALVITYGCPGACSHRHMALSTVNGMVESGGNLVLHLVDDAWVAIPLRAFATPADRALFTGRVAACMAPPGWSPWLARTR